MHILRTKARLPGYIHCERGKSFVSQDVSDFLLGKGVASGIGLKNLEKRLKLYFEDDYTYEVSKENSIYAALLKLELR